MILSYNVRTCICVNFTILQSFLQLMNIEPKITLDSCLTKIQSKWTIIYNLLFLDYDFRHLSRSPVVTRRTANLRFATERKPSFESPSWTRASRLIAPRWSWRSIRPSLTSAGPTTTRTSTATTCWRSNAAESDASWATPTRRTEPPFCSSEFFRWRHTWRRKASRSTSRSTRRRKMCWRTKTEGSIFRFEKTENVADKISLEKKLKRVFCTWNINHVVSIMSVFKFKKLYNT